MEDCRVEGVEEDAIAEEVGVGEDVGAIDDGD